MSIIIKCFFFFVLFYKIFFYDYLHLLAMKIYFAKHLNIYFRLCMTFANIFNLRLFCSH